MYLRNGHLVTSFEEQSNSKSESSSESQSSLQSRLNMDPPPPQDELRQAIAELTARLGHLEARYDEDNANNGRNNNRHGPHPRQDHRDNEDNSAKHVKVEAPTFDGVKNPQVYNDWVQDEPITLSRFRKGLNYDLQRELAARQISTLDDAYTLVQDLEPILRP